MPKLFSLADAIEKQYRIRENHKHFDFGSLCFFDIKLTAEFCFFVIKIQESNGITR